MTTKRLYKQAGYRIAHTRDIVRKDIVDQWDDTLRFVATIRLGFASASQLFMRLNSYSLEHPLYKALKELGRIGKTLHLLRYCDDLPFRQRIQKQLNVGELSNKFHDHIFWATGSQVPCCQSTVNRSSSNTLCVAPLCKTR